MLKLTLAVIVMTLITACSPKFDWRDVRGSSSPYLVLMPGKPSELSREIRLGEQTVTMNMTATQIDGVNFAVGAIKMNNATEAKASVAVIRNALLQKMTGRIVHEKETVSEVNGIATFTDDFDAVSSTATPGSITQMQGRLVARDAWVFQVLVVGPERDINQEAAETFLTSFKPG